MRLDYAAIAPEVTNALAGVNAALLRAALDKHLMDLLFLCVSQISRRSRLFIVALEGDRFVELEAKSAVTKERAPSTARRMEDQSLDVQK